MNRMFFSRFQKATSYLLQLTVISCSLVLLMGGLAAAQAPSLSVDGCDVNSAGRGEEICVPVILQKGVASVASAGFTLAYDCQVLTLPDGASDVLPGEALTSGQSVVAVVEEDGTCQVQVLVTPPIGLPPIPEILNGELVQICFTVLVDAPPGCSALTFVAREVGDTDGNNIPDVDSTDGGVSVQDPCQGVICDPTGNPCTVNVCDPADGICKEQNEANGTPCPDGDVCNGDETCVDGFCEAGTPLICDDGDLCTIDSCDPATGCVFEPVVCPPGQHCDPGDGLCKEDQIPCDPPDCNDNDLCTIDACVDGTCVNTPIDCEDGLFCTLNSCFEGECVAISACPPAIDGCVFRNDSCDEENDQCVDRADDTQCDDGLFCNGAETCNIVTGGCEEGTPPCDPATETCNEELDQCEPLAPEGDVDIVKLVVDRIVTLQDGTVSPRPIRVLLKVKKEADGQAAMATVVGMQNGAEVYNESMMVDGLAPGESTRLRFPSFTPTAGGIILWTATIADGDPDVDQMNRRSRVVEELNGAE